MTARNTSDANHRLLRLLTNSVRVMTVSQVSYALSEPRLERAHSRLRRLKSQGLVELSVTWFCQPALPDSPLFLWQPTQPKPDCGKLGRVASRRWSAEPSSETIAVATTKARDLYGEIPVRSPRESEIAHDVWVTELFLRRYVHKQPTSWLHEDGFDELFPEGAKPDAALVSQGKESATPIAIELLGNYRREKIEQFHTYCHEYGIPYELW